jgi:cytochrome c oxidase assembly protein subunit 15
LIHVKLADIPRRIIAIDVAPDSSLALPAAGSAAGAAAPGHRAIAAWLLVCCALVFAMVVVGGVTRLTHSGLSIVEWQPIVGTLPPLGDAAWHEAFEKYKLTPEYRQVNHGMSLAEFKGIFWWEYFHRLLGRVIGVVFFVPLAWFWARGRLDRPLAWKLAGIFALGGLQGAMGWYMVMSGLVDDPRVSQFRLTAHLAIAVLIFATMLWVAMDLLAPRMTADLDASRTTRPTPGSVRRLDWWITGVVGYMVVTGGFVAGIRAGKAYNTFPLMQGHIVPPEIFMIEPWWQNFFYNMATVQFDHRLGAWALAFLVPWLWLRVRKDAVSPRGRLAANLLLAAVIVQIALGITALLLAVPVALGAAHQGGAVVLLAAALFANHSLR